MLNQVPNVSMVTEPIPGVSGTVLTGFAAVVLSLVHINAAKLKFLRRSPRSHWLSIGSGVSVAYIFVHVLPDLGAAQEEFAASTELLNFIEHHVYVLALVGMLLFYGLERAAQISKKESLSAGEGDVTQPGVFWLHMASFSLYNALIGYLLTHREEPGLVGLGIYTTAMALHFVVNDYSLSDDHKRAYTTKGRWLLSAAVVLGWVVGSQTEISEAITASLFAFLAGGIILNVLKEELPEANENRYWTFAAGALCYSGLLLLLG